MSWVNCATEGGHTDDATKSAAIEVLGRVGLDLPKGKLAFLLSHDRTQREEIVGERQKGREEKREQGSMASEQCTASLCTYERERQGRHDGACGLIRQLRDRRSLICSTW